MSSYSTEEVEEILRRALETQPVDELSHEDLIDAASEAGIDRELVEAAASQLQEAREIQAEEDAILSRRRRGFLSSIYTYVVVNAFLVLLDYMSGPGWWVQWVLAGWGVGLALAARPALLPDRDKLRQKAKRRLAKKNRRRMEKKAKEVFRTEVDRAIQTGVDALVEAASRRLEGTHAHGRGRRVRVYAADGEYAEPDVVGRTGRSGRRRR